MDSYRKGSGKPGANGRVECLGDIAAGRRDTDRVLSDVMLLPEPDLPDLGG